MIDAYVLGRPMPSSSSFRVRAASLYRVGGCVLWPFGSSSTHVRLSPTATAGNKVSRSANSASGSSDPSTYARRYPGNSTERPPAWKSASPASTTIARRRPRASAIWLATVRFQIRS